jgi:hypothetical protein
MLLVFPLCFRKIQFFLCGWESFSIHSLGQFIGAESSWFSVRVAREFIPGPLEQTRANAFIFLLLFSRSQCCRRRSGTGLGTRPGQDFHSCFELTGWALRSIFGFGAGFKVPDSRSVQQHTVSKYSFFFVPRFGPARRAHHR